MSDKVNDNMKFYLTKVCWFNKQYYSFSISDSSTTITAEPVKRPCLFFYSFNITFIP